MTGQSKSPADADIERFRDVLGRFCSGIVVVTALDKGRPIGFTCQSFASLSLDPRLIMLSPGRTSTTWPSIRNIGSFCVNVLAEDQADVSARFGRPGKDKFEGVRWVQSPGGAPLILGSLAWIDCQLWAEHDGGDHTIALGQVTNFDAATSGSPVVFFRGSYAALTLSTF
ncbi:flavin reductase family protein [Rhodococcus sp. HNM0563]|uniref:flavin reductase family protein n=1 Tax=Rhodococcus sp. HNM0563 TaxID=2716339 RepID=UPI00146B8BD7|nr:flavin reductase family protein [Rhodococcus sp. HNM0563]NLU64214.1 flavin reductase family protein [Rhodococcus sp. HNM0563]